MYAHPSSEMALARRAPQGAAFLRRPSRPENFLTRASHRTDPMMRLALSLRRTVVGLDRSTLVPLLAVSVAVSGVLSAQTSIDPAALSPAMRFRYIGPVGNRVASVAGVPGDPNTYYAGAASGGIWKTTDAGVHWTPMFDDETISSIGALAVAPSNPNIVWAGTGEP